MPLKNRPFKRRESRDVGSESEWNDLEEHKKIFRPTLETLLRRFVAKPRRCEIDSSSKKLGFLDDMEFFEKFRATYPNVEVSKDRHGRKLILRGKGEEFDDAYNHCSWKLQEIAMRYFPRTDDEKIWDVIADSQVQCYMKSLFASKNIKAQVCQNILYRIKSAALAAGLPMVISNWLKFWRRKPLNERNTLN